MPASTRALTGVPVLPPDTPVGRRLLRFEVLVVLAVSLGASGVFALINFLGDLTRGPLSGQQTTVLGSQAPGRPWLDLSFQVADLVFGLAPVALVGYLLARSGESFAALGGDLRRPGRDLGWGAGLAALIGGSGLALYLISYAVGGSLNVVAASLPAVWWRIPVEIASAAQNGLLEEVVVAGYLLHRLAQLGVRRTPALATSAVLRGSYHLYQGVGGFVGNVAMGLIFGWLYQRYGRIAPLVVAHTLIDSVAFVGYTLLAGHVGWLPR